MTAKSKPPKTNALTYAVLASVIIGLLLLSPFFAVVVISAIAAYIFYPVYEWLLKKLHKPGTASAITTVLVLLLLIVPIVIISLLTFNEAQSAVTSISDYADGRDFATVTDDALAQVNTILSSATNGSLEISLSQVRDTLGQAASQASSFALGFVSGAIGGVSTAIASIVLFLYIFSSLLIHNKKVITVFRGLNPLGDDIATVYLQKAGAMTKAMVSGQFIIALCQGIVGAITLWIAGIDLFWLSAMLLTLLSLIPLGGGILTIPVGIVLLLAGNIWQGLVVLLGHFLVVTNIDNVLRPLLVPKNARLNSALTMLAVFSGISFFGLIGIVVGPVLMILIVTTFQIYIERTSPTKATKKTLAS